jgi:hypothetical protein
MFNFSANHLVLLSRTECRRCVGFVMKDDSTRRVYRLYDFTKIPDHRVRPIRLRFRKGQQRRQTLSRKSNPSSRITNTRALPRLLFLLTAREGGL